MADSNGRGSVSWPWNQTKPVIYIKNQTKLFKFYEAISTEPFMKKLEPNQIGL